MYSDAAADAMANSDADFFDIVGNIGSGAAFILLRPGMYLSSCVNNPADVPMTADPLIRSAVYTVNALLR